MTYPEKWVEDCTRRERNAGLAITVWAAVSVTVIVVLGSWFAWRVFARLVQP